MSEIRQKSEEQDEAEAEVQGFKDDLGPFVVAAETTRMAMVFTDAWTPESPIIFANDSFLALTGYERNEVLGQSFNFLLSDPASSEALAEIKAEFEGDPHADSEMLCRRKDGREFWAAIFVSPVRDEKGDVVQYFASFVDLTKHKQEQAESRMLINELNHRVKNTLSTVQSIVYQALRTATDPEVIRESIESRLLALSRSHDLLTRENWKSAGLVDIVGAALEPFGVSDGRAERFLVSGKNIRFPPSSALALGIAFHELATNAVKYGAFSNDAGSISITWAIDPTPRGARLVLKWIEKDGPPVTPPSRQGFGSRVIERGLAHELEGTATLDYQPAGLVCIINIPAPHSARNG
jgi:PAS domain S-box-containing protein